MCDNDLRSKASLLQPPWGVPAAGRLRLADKLRLVRDAIVVALRAWRPDRRLALSAVALDEITEPDTPLANAAARVGEIHQPAWLLNHALRTWLWAELLGRRDGVAYDRELLYAACLLHDLGLTPLYLPDQGGCFAISGARAAFEIARAAGASVEAASLVAEAIALHLDVRVGLEKGAEAHLLNQGASIDVIGGGRLRELDPGLRARVVERHPREGFARALAGAMREQATRSPATRIGFYCQHFQFTRRIEHSPFERMNAGGTP